MQREKRKIGEILINSGFITKEMLAEALEYQKKCGGNVTQYLVSSGYIDEMNLARCISDQFNCPYLPLWAYDIPADIIALVPYQIAQKYWLLPVDKMANLLTVVMADPFDETAISEVEGLTNCKVQPFVGLLSDIIKAIERYYDVRIQNAELRKAKKSAPLFVYGKEYAGIERRRSVRINANIVVHFPAQNEYREAHTKDVSMHGLLFQSNRALPMGAFIVLQIELSKELSPYPIAAVAQVVRVMPIGEKKFDIGVNIIKIPKDDLDRIIRYALSVRSD
ncbi:MAG: PilZ domain-containing protein [Candidatus Omnitrophica bacterium]|nr:PilZ domain-containing protein [Candidatus Omnitrophota bacterium]